MLTQEYIAKTIEEKVTGEQRRYLLNELLKAIKKVVQSLFSFRLFIYSLHQEFMMNCISIARKNELYIF
jgi:ATP-dependent Lon protease